MSPAPFDVNKAKKIQSLVQQATGRTDVQFYPLAGEEDLFDVFLEGKRLGTFGYFGNQPVIERLRIEGEKYLGPTGGGLSMHQRAVEATQRLWRAVQGGANETEAYNTLTNYLGGVEYPGQETPGWKPRGAKYLEREWQRTYPQAWQGLQQSSMRFSHGYRQGLQGESFGFPLYDTGGYVPTGGLHPVESMYPMSAFGESFVGFPESEAGIHTDIGGKTARRWKLQQRGAILPTSNRIGYPRNIPTSYSVSRLAEGRVPAYGVGRAAYPDVAAMRAPGADFERGITVLAATSLRAELGIAGQNVVDPTQFPSFARPKVFRYDLPEGVKMEQLPEPYGKLGEYGRTYTLGVTSEGKPLTMEAKYGEPHLAWAAVTGRAGGGLRFQGEVEERQEAGRMMESKFLNKSLLLQETGLGERYGIPGLAGMFTRWKSTRQGAVQTLLALDPADVRQRLSKFGWAGDPKAMIWDAQADVPVMRAYEELMREGSVMLRKTTTVAESMLPGLKSRMIGEPKMIPGTGLAEVTLEDPYYVGPHLLQMQGTYMGRARLSPEELQYMTERGDAARAKHFLKQSSYSRAKYTEPYNLYLSQTRGGKALGVQMRREAVDIGKLDWNKLATSLDPNATPEEFLGAMAATFGRTPIRLGTGTVVPSALSMYQHRAQDEFGNMAQRGVRLYAEMMQGFYSKGFNDTTPDLGFLREWRRMIGGHEFRRNMLSAEMSRGGVEGPVHGSMALRANEVYLSRNALSRMTGITDQQQLQAMEEAIERAAQTYNIMEGLPFGVKGELPQSAMPWVAELYRRPIASIMEQMGGMMNIRAGAEFAKMAELEGADIAVNPIMQSIQWGDYDADRVAAFFAGKISWDEVGQPKYKYGPGDEPQTEEDFIGRLSRSLMSRSGAGKPESSGAADLLKYIWTSSPPGAQLSDLAQKMSEFGTGSEALAQALGWTSGWQKGGAPKTITREQLFQQLAENAQSKQMMAETYQSWGRWFKHTNPGMTVRGRRMWSGIFGGTYQEPLDVRSVPKPIRRLMEIQGFYNAATQRLAPRLTESGWEVDPKTKDIRPKFESISLAQLPAEIVKNVFEAMRGPGMKWTTEQGSLGLKPRWGTEADVAWIKGLAESSLTSGQATYQYLSRFYNDPNSDLQQWEQAMSGGAMFLSSSGSAIFRRRMNDPRYAEEFGELTPWQRELAESGVGAREYMDIMGKKEIAPVETAGLIQRQSTKKRQPLRQIARELGIRLRGGRPTAQRPTVTDQPSTAAPPEASVPPTTATPAANQPAAPAEQVAQQAQDSLAQQALDKFFGGSIANLKTHIEEIRAAGGGQQVADRQTRAAVNWMVNEAKQSGANIPSNLQEWASFVQQAGASFGPDSSGTWSHTYGAAQPGAEATAAPSVNVPKQKLTNMVPPPDLGPADLSNMGIPSAPRKKATTGGSGSGRKPPRGGGTTTAVPPPDEEPGDIGDVPGVVPGGSSRQRQAQAMAFAQGFGTAWIGQGDIDAFREAAKEVDKWGKQIADASKNTEDFNANMRAFMKEYGGFENAMARLTGKAEALEFIATDVSTPKAERDFAEKRAMEARMAIEDAMALGGVQAMGPAYQRYGELTYRDQLRGAIEGGGGITRQRIVHGMDRIFSGWELMRLQRMWGMTGGPTFQEYMPAAAQAGMAAWQASQVIGGYAPGLPSGAAGGVMAAEAAKRRAIISAGNAGYDAWGWAMPALGAWRGAQAVLGPAIGAGLVGTSLGATGIMLAGKAATAGVATGMALPYGIALAAGLGAYATGRYFAAGAEGTATNQIAAATSGWGQARAAIGGGLTNFVDIFTRGPTGTGMSGLEWSEQLATQGQTLLNTKWGDLNATQRAAALNWYAKELTGRTGTIFSGMDETQILQAQQQIAEYYEPPSTPWQTAYTHGAYEQALESYISTGRSAADYEQLAAQMRGGSGGARMIEEYVRAMPAAQRRSYISALGQYAPAAQWYSMSSIMSRVSSGAWQKRTGQAAVALESAFNVAPQMAQAYGVPVNSAMGTGFLTQLMNYMTPEQVQMAGMVSGVSGPLYQETSKNFLGSMFTAAMGGTPIANLAQWANIYRGQGGVAQAFGMPTSTAARGFEANLARGLITPGGININQYQQLTGMAGFAAGAMGYSMAAAGVEGGAVLNQFRAGMGMPLVQGATSLYDFSQPGAIYGMNQLNLRALQDLQTSAAYNYNMRGLRGQIGMAQSALGAFYQTTGLQDQLRAMNTAYQRRQFDYGTANADMQMRQALESMNLQQRQWALNRAYQATEMNIGFEQQQQRWAWQTEDIASGRQWAGVQYSWGMEDVNRAIRFATGREKQQLIRQRGRMEETYAYQEGRRNIEEERFETQKEWEEERFERQKAYFEEVGKLEQEGFEMRIRHLHEQHDLQMGQQNEAKANFEATLIVEEQLRDVQEAQQEKQLKFSLDELKRQEDYQKKVYAWNKEETKLRRAVEDAQAKFLRQQIDDMSAGGDLWNAWQQLIIDIKDWLSTVVPGGSGTDNTEKPPPTDEPPPPTGEFQHGGPVSPNHSYIVGEGGPELFVPTGGGRIVPLGGRGAVSVGNVNITVPPGDYDLRALGNVIRRQVAAAIEDIANEQRGAGEPW